MNNYIIKSNLHCAKGRHEKNTFFGQETILFILMNRMELTPPPCADMPVKIGLCKAYPYIDNSDESDCTFVLFPPNYSNQLSTNIYADKAQEQVTVLRNN